MLALSIKSLNKSFKSTKAVSGLSLEVAKGDFFALLGPNGAGKTTTIGMIVGLVNKDSGSISVFGKDQEQEPNFCKLDIGFVPQEFNFNIFETVENIILHQAGFYGIERSKAIPVMEELLNKLNLSDKRKARSRSLSGGMKRRLMIARALINRPKLLILDEPSAGVDVENRHQMWDFLQDLSKQGTTIILTTHYLEEAEKLCNKVAIIDHGKLVRSGLISEVLTGEKLSTIVLTIEELSKAEELLSASYDTNIVDNKLEVVINNNAGLRDLFAKIAEFNIEIQNIEYKKHTLEEFYLSLTRS